VAEFPFNITVWPAKSAAAQQEPAALHATHRVDAPEIFTTDGSLMWPMRCVAAARFITVILIFVWLGTWRICELQVAN
jgi:hypothetical protein